MSILMRSCLGLTAWALLTASFVQAAEPDLPPPAIPGLRYYYPPTQVTPRTLDCDVCVYGGTSGGAAAAIQAARMGKKAVLLEFGKHVGGLTSGGLSHTDGGGPSVCGGIAREFYAQAGQANFPPSTAEALYEEMLKAAGVEVHRLCHLDKVEKDGARIVSITMEDGLQVRAAQYIDATYEGDLFARAGVSFTYGREANSQYGETYDGIREPGKGGHNWPVPVDPYRTPGDPSSGLLPRVNDNPGVPGEGDKRIQAFCFRMRLTRTNPLPFPKPNVYKPDEYELLARLFASGANPKIQFSIDTNNHHLFSGAYFIDFVGGNYGWPDGDYATREQIFQDHANYQIGVMWFLANDERLPKETREKFQAWGLPRDQYQETSGWTHQLYIREGRRMVSDYVMTQHNCQGKEVPTDSIGLASYNMDSHHCQMTVVNGAVRNEGNVEIGVRPYPVSYRAITPKRAECQNLLAPVCLSSTHIAFGSIRMEPVFMILSQSAATAACLAIDDQVAVQDVEYAKLRTRLLADDQILDFDGPLPGRGGKTWAADKLPGVVVDNPQAKTQGEWLASDVTSPRVGDNYLHDDNKHKGELSASYTAKLPAAGRYEVRISWPVNPNRATNVPVRVQHAGGSKEIVVNQQQKPAIEGVFHSLGVFAFEETGVVEISNAETNGYVIVDAVQFLPVKADE
ncbi:FAD-dependent oxidoreductase [Lignipirellula cremea]|uniref:Xanthan lyase n=1 Tax=Lignipirellula cremea TaxID=2528010 RepID=A0A518E2I6_9BACT|nr:FAD-dependent oxidoreductase [Lignipirellula cremea]QDU98284.1 Xanthan lyase precursor [Lignipirellula cremea]